MVDKKIADKLWNDVYGDTEWALDCFGARINRNDYNDSERLRNDRPKGSGEPFNYGWTVVEIKPNVNFTPDQVSFWNNLEPMHLVNAKLKDGKERFERGGVEYSVVQCEACFAAGVEGYGIKNEKKGERIDWKYVSNSFYENNES